MHRPPQKITLQRVGYGWAKEETINPFQWINLKIKIKNKKIKRSPLKRSSLHR